MNQPEEGLGKVGFVLKCVNDSGKNMRIIVVFGKEVVGGLRYGQQSAHKENQSFNFSVSETYRTTEIKGPIKYLATSAEYSGEKENLFSDSIFITIKQHR